MDNKSTMRQEEPVLTTEKVDMETSERERLAELAMRGEHSALLSLCEMITRNVMFRVSCKLPNRMDAEDATQEILIRVCKNIHELQNPKAFGGWLNSIIVNETNRYLVSNNKYAGQVVSLDEYLETSMEADEELLPEEYVVQAELREAVMDIVKSLPERQMEAVMLRYYEGMSVTDTADAMGISKQSASQYLTLAKEKIKREILKQAKKTGTLYSIAFLPVGGLLRLILRQEAAQIPPIDKLWIEQAVGHAKISESMIGTAKAGTALGSLTAITATVVMSVVITIGSLLTKDVSTTVEHFTFTQPVMVNAMGRVMFTGGDPAYEHLNPRHAIVQLSGGYGELTAVSWKIVTIDHSRILYSGTGGNADEGLARLLENGPADEYWLIFSIEGQGGGKYTLSRSFIVDTPYSGGQL